MKTYTIVFSSLMLIAGLIGAEYAEALNFSAGQLLPVEGDTTLTVVFALPDVFDPGAGAGVPVFDVKDVTSGEGEMVGVDFAESDGVAVPAPAEDIPVVVGGNPAPSLAVPEPSTLLLLGLGMLVLLGLARRKKI